MGGTVVKASRSKESAQKRPRQLTATLLVGMLFLSMGTQASAQTTPTPTPTPSSTATSAEPFPAEFSAVTDATQASVSAEPSASIESSVTSEATPSAESSATTDGPTDSLTPEPTGVESSTAPAEMAATVGVSPQAATSYLCSPDDLYLLTLYSSAGNPAILKYSNGTLTTAVSSLGTLSAPEPDALAVSQSGYAYFMGSLPAKGSALTVYRVALADGSRDTFTGATVLDTPYSTDRTPPAGAINPVTGIYYYALATSTAWDFYAFDTNTNTSIGYVGRLTPPEWNSLGDIAFDGDGNLYLGINTATGNLYKVDAASVPTTVRSLATAIPFTSLGSTAETYMTGLAYMAPTSGTKSLYSSSYYNTAINVRSPGSTNDSSVYATINNQYLYDMASCAGPSKPTLSLSKNVESRVNTGDQFTLTVHDSEGATVGSPATTSGSATGTQSAKVGPVDVTEGSTYTLQEAASGTTTLSDYAITAACTMSGSPVATTGSNGTFAVTIPSDAKGLIDCVITNGPPKIELKKNVAKRVTATDQFKLDIRDSSGSIGTATTTGTATGVQAATASASVSPGTTYTIQETGTGATNLARYNTSAVCTAGGTTVAATKTANGTFDVTVPAGTKGVVACEISNAPIPTLSLAKHVVGRVNDTDQFTLSVADAGGAALGTPATTVGTANGVQGVKVAPVDVVAGQTYTIKEVGVGSTPLADYEKSATCKAADGSTVATSADSNGNWTVTIPDGAMDLISCEIKNVAPPSITVTKTLSGGRAAASDQFTVQLRTGGDTGTVLDTPGNDTTEGVGTEVSAGTGTTGKVTATAGTAYTITEAAAIAGVDFSKYSSTVTCTDATGTQSGLPNKTALASGVTVTPEPGAQISCVLNNAKTGSIGVGEGLTCEAGYIYGIANTNPTPGTDYWGNPGSGTLLDSQSYVYKINVSTGAATVAQAKLPNTVGTTRYSGRTNALAISQGGLYSYYSTQRTSTYEPAGLPVWRQDNKTGTTVHLGTMAIPSNVNASGGIASGAGTVRGGINPTDGMYWISSSETINTSTTRHHFWAFDTLANDGAGNAIGYVGYIEGAKASWPYGGNGDLVFDQEGNMLFVTSDGTNGELWRISGLTKALPPKTTATSIGSSLTMLKLTDLASSGQFNGVTFDNDGYLYVSYASGNNSVIDKLDPNTGAKIGSSITVAGLNNPDGYARRVVDLADCNDPGNLTLQKSYPVGRVAATDNVHMQIRRADVPNTPIPGGDVTTTGPATGLQTNAAVVAIGIPTRTYILRETVAAGTPLTGYSTTLSCIDKTNANLPVPVTQVSQGEYELTFQGVTEGSDGDILANVVCTFENSPRPQIAVEKAGSTQCLIPGAEPTDVTYTYTVTNPGVVALSDVTLTDDKGDTEYLSGDLDSNGLLDPGESWVYRMTSSLNATTTNTATVTGVNPANGQVATATDTWTVAPSPVEVTKTSSATGPVKAGDELTYTMTVTNTGEQDATNVVLTDQLPDGVTYKENSAQKTYWTGETVPGGTQSGTWTTTLPDFGFSSKSSLQTFSTVGSVPADAQLTSYSITLKGSSTDGKNDVALRGYLPGKPVESAEPGTGATVWTPTAARWFSVPYQKFGSGSGAWTTLSSGTVDASGPASGEYTLQWWDYSNNASYPDPENTASGVEVTLNYIYTETASTRTQATDAAHAPGEMVTAADAVTLKPGETMTVTFAVTVDDPLDSAITELTNTALVTYSGDDACASGDSVTDPVEGAPEQTIKVEKLGQHCDVGQTTCALNGAVFALYDTDPSVAGATPIADGITADEVNGATFTSKELQAGTYWLVETKAPTGFTLLPEPIQFTLASTGITLTDPVDRIVTLKAGDTFTILVTDTTPAPLPEAGGAGPWPFYAVGLLLLVAAGLYHQKTSVRWVAPRRAAQ